MWTWRSPLLALASAALVALSGCGSSAQSTTSAGGSGTTTATSTTSDAATPPAPGIPAAEHPNPGQFPAAGGRSLEQIASVARTSAQFGAATGTFTPGRDRVAFAISDSAGTLLYAPTVLYVASSPTAHGVLGPFPAPADPMGVAPQYRSKQYGGPGDIQAVYETTLPFPHAGTFYVLALSRRGGQMVGSPGEISVVASSQIPRVGQPAPAIDTDTLAADHGDLSLVTTRLPPENMHSVSLRQVLGHRPVALLFSTPQLCTSRICGPVTDLLVSLQQAYAGRIVFIHQEVYADNQPAKGLRAQMKAYHLQTEPWLFTIDGHGIIRARLEGAFGINAARAALDAALR